MKQKKIFLGAALASLAALSLASCGASNSDLSVCLASTPDQVDPALNSAVDGASYAVHLFGGLVRYVPGTNGSLKLEADLAESLPTAQSVGEDGKVQYTFKLREGIKFSDGTEIKASDVVKSWNRAASYTPDDNSPDGATDADYNYMFEIIDGYTSLAEKAEAGTLTAADYKNFLNVVADDDARTVKVTLVTDVPYFFELCAFPAYMVLKNADTLDSKGSWAKDPSKFVGSGAYKLSSFTKDVSLVVEKADTYWDAANVKQEKINFVFSDDTSATLAQYNTGSLALIDDIDSETIAAKKNDADYHVQGQLGTYYVCWNVNSNMFNDVLGTNEQAKQDVRNAISLLIDRQDIIDNVAMGGQTVSTGFVGSGLTDPAGGEFVDHNGPNEDGKGWTGADNTYDENVATAIATLRNYFDYDETTKKFTNFPTIKYILNTNAGHQAIAEKLKATFNNYGINMTIDNSDWASFLQTRKQGNFDVARNGWLADYNDPISFLDLWTSNSGNNDCQLGKGDAEDFDFYSIDCSTIDGYSELSGTWSETYDTLISSIKKESSTEKRYKLMHKAETLLMSTGCITPIYNYVDNWLQNTKLTDVYVSPLGYKYFTWASYK